MAVATFDTLKFANTLKAAGVPEKQAEAQAFAEVIQGNFKDLATKDDLQEVVKDLRHEMRESEQRLTARIDATAAQLSANLDNTAAKSSANLDAAVAKLSAALEAAVAKL